MRAIRFNHLSISTRNLEESLRFYEELFGLERIPTYNFGFTTRYLRCGPQQLHIFELEDSVPERQHFALDVDDFEAVYRAEGARRAGVGDLLQLYVRAAGRRRADVPARPRGPPGRDRLAGRHDLDRSAFPELKKLSDRVPQTGEALEATLYLDRKKTPASAG